MSFVLITSFTSSMLGSGIAEPEKRAEIPLRKQAFGNGAMAANTKEHNDGWMDAIVEWHKL